MLSTERADFETHLAVLFGGFPTFLTPPRIEAYWRGLAKMPLSLFVRCIDFALSENGPEKLPTLNDLWLISKRLRAPAPPAQKAPAPVHPLQGAANSALFALLRERGHVSNACIQQLVKVKNHIVSSLPVDANPGEVRDVLIGAFENHWVLMPEAERVSAISRRFGGAR